MAHLIFGAKEGDFSFEVEQTILGLCNVLCTLN